MTVTIYRELEQGSPEWLAARCGILTASQIGKLITKSTPDPLTVACIRCSAAAGEPCLSLARKTPTPLKTTHDERALHASQMPSVLTSANNDTSRALALTLAAERITRHVEYVHPTWDMQRGTDDEPWARMAYAEHAQVHVEEVGFITREEADYKLGFSPDGLVGDDGLIEIKSRKPHTQISTILEDRVPGYNVAQIQCGLYVSGRKWCDYISFAQGLPLYVKRVRPDTAWFNAIDAAARAFETNIAEIITRYNTATHGLPTTERRSDFEDIRI